MTDVKPETRDKNVDSILSKHILDVHGNVYFGDMIPLHDGNQLRPDPFEKYLLAGRETVHLHQ